MAAIAERVRITKQLEDLSIKNTDIVQQLQAAQRERTPRTPLMSPHDPAPFRHDSAAVRALQEKLDAAVNERNRIKRLLVRMQAHTRKHSPGDSAWSPAVRSHDGSMGQLSSFSVDGSELSVSDSPMKGGDCGRPGKISSVSTTSLLSPTSTRAPPSADGDPLEAAVGGSGTIFPHGSEGSEGPTGEGTPQAEKPVLDQGDPHHGCATGVDVGLSMLADAGSIPADSDRTLCVHWDELERTCVRLEGQLQMLAVNMPEICLATNTSKSSNLGVAGVLVAGSEKTISQHVRAAPCW